MQFAFEPLPPAYGLARALIRCGACSHTWELQSTDPVPQGTYRASCPACEAEGAFTSGSAEAMGLPLDASLLLEVDDAALEGLHGDGAVAHRAPIEVYTELAAKHGLIREGDKLDQNVVDLMSELVTMCARIGDGFGDPEYGGTAGQDIRAELGLANRNDLNHGAG